MLEQCWAGAGEREEFVVGWVSVARVMGSDMMQVQNRCFSSPHCPGDSAVAPKIGHPKRDGPHLAFEVCPTSSLGLYKNSCKIFLFIYLFALRSF